MVSSEKVILEEIFILYRTKKGYEVVGFENLPADKPVLIIFYHAPAVVDMIFLGAYAYVKFNRKIRFVTERKLFKVPRKFEMMHQNA